MKILIILREHKMEPIVHKNEHLILIDTPVGLTKVVTNIVEWQVLIKIQISKYKSNKLIDIFIMFLSNFSTTNSQSHIVIKKIPKVIGKMKCNLEVLLFLV